jgi:sporulation protein YlmC with PRC-barrel domain
MSKFKLLSSAAVAALIAMPAFAQTSTTTPPASRPGTSSPMGSSSASQPSLPSDLKAAKVSEIVGKNVYNSNNEKVGDINEIVVPKSGGGQTMAVIGVGGFLGIGEKEAAVPIDQLKVQNDKIVAAGLTKESLKEHADYKAQKDSYTKLDRNQVVGQAGGAMGSSPSGSSSSTGSTGTSGSSSSGSMGSGSSTGSGSMGSTGSSTSGNSTGTPKQ